MSGGYGSGGSGQTRGTDILSPVNTTRASLDPRTPPCATAGRHVARWSWAPRSCWPRPAHADGHPEGWSDPEPVDGCTPCRARRRARWSCSSLIRLAVYLPAMVRGEKVTPGAARERVVRRPAPGRPGRRQGRPAGARGRGHGWRQWQLVSTSPTDERHEIDRAIRGAERPAATSSRSSSAPPRASAPVREPPARLARRAVAQHPDHGRPGRPAARDRHRLRRPPRPQRRRGRAGVLRCSRPSPPATWSAA